MTVPHSLRLRIEKQIGSELVSEEVVSGGCINRSFRVAFSDGSQYFLKWNAEAPPGLFQAEAEGLLALRKADALSVPEVLSFADHPEDTPSFLLMEALVPGARGESGDAELGRGLAKLHRVEEHNFGFHGDNYIGYLPQRNTWEGSWSEFFFAHRLSAQAALGEESGWFADNFAKLLVEKEEKIRTILSEGEERPSLLHGDLWSGNVFWSETGPALIDPAVYYGSREADIAFTECFSRFGEEFYRAYHEEFSLCSGYERRRPILNLYHQMTHANMFGGSYVQDVYRTLQAI